MALLLIVNLHGAINSSGPVRKALEELKVERRFSASVVPGDEPTLGTLKLCKDRLAWAPVDAPFLAALLKKRGMVSTTKHLDSAALKALGYKDYEELAAKMVKDGMRLSALEGVRPFFRLAPPKGGFKRSMRRGWNERGLLGGNPKLAELVGRMI
jgi:large subunit ribosomal protein L30